MASFTAKRGDSLSEYEGRMFGRYKVPLDLTNATVYIYMREDGSETNFADGVECVKLSADTGESYPQRIQGPNVELSDIGDFQVYFKAMYGSNPVRIPSDGYLWFRVEPNFEV